jgi:hypothetical protein
MVLKPVASWFDDMSPGNFWGDTDEKSMFTFSQLFLGGN